MADWTLPEPAAHGLDCFAPLASKRIWQVEVTFAEMWRHWGVEIQRQWSDLAILRITPDIVEIPRRLLDYLTDTLAFVT